MRRARPDREQGQRRRHRHGPPHEDRDPPPDEALHHDLAGHGPDRGRRDPGGEQRDPEDRPRVGVDEAAEPRRHLREVVADRVEPARVEHRSRHGEHGHVDRARDAHRDHYVDELESEDAAARLVVHAHDPPLGERGVEVDHVRHHGRADDPDRQQRGLAVRKAGHEGPVRDSAARHGREEHLDREGEHDHADECRDHRLPAAKPPLLESEHRERRDRREQARDEERKVEQDREPERGARELREVGRHRHGLGLEPEEPGQLPRKAVAADLGEIPSRRDPELRGERLDDHRH